MASDLITHRKKFDDLIQTHSVLKFMEGGNAGRISFDVIISPDEGGHDIIRFKSIERAPMIDINNRLFRRSFPLSTDHKLLENTLLRGDSRKEELLLFAYRHLYDKDPLQAVVSLLNPRYIATAFRVSPLGGLLTCYHNLSLFDGDGPIEELYIHRSAVSPSYSFAGSMRERVEYVPCEMPVTDENTSTDPVDTNQPSSDIALKHQDIAYLRSSPGQHFLIPYAHELPVGEPVVCVGYPGKFSTHSMQAAYSDLLPTQVPSYEEYFELFTVGNLSVSPGPLLGCSDGTAIQGTAVQDTAMQGTAAPGKTAEGTAVQSMTVQGTVVLTCEVATTPGYAGSPICILNNPRMFIGIHCHTPHIRHTHIRKGSDYTYAISVRDAGFYHIYSTLVVPELRMCISELCSEDIYAINSYLRAYGNTEPLVESPSS